jgi:formamidopyrimidine-DNA glycosylase
MPEGPEVRRFGDDLAREISGKTLADVKVLTGRYLKKSISGIEDFKARLPLSVVGTGVHGKFLYWILEDCNFVFNTLGMTGHWSKTPGKHSRVEFKFSSGESVFFEDTRNFGTISLERGKNKFYKKINSLGPDMLAEDVTDDVFIDRLQKHPDWQITSALMDQSVVSGVGNYVKAEALYRSNISPLRAVRSITRQEASLLNKSIKDILRESYNAGGTTVRDYRRMDGSLGVYTFDLRVYNKKYDPAGNPVVKTLTEDNRTTHWVPNTQK